MERFQNSSWVFIEYGLPLKARVGQIFEDTFQFCEESQILMSTSLASDLPIISTISLLGVTKS